MSQPTSDTYELPFRVWHNLARAFGMRRRGLDRILNILAQHPNAIVYGGRCDDGAQTRHVALWSGEARAFTSQIQSPPAVMQRLPRVTAEFVPVLLRDVFAGNEMLTELLDRVASLVLYDPDQLPDFPDWVWTFPQHSHCNLLIEDGHLIVPPGWELKDGHYPELRAEHCPVRIIDGQGRMGLMTGTGEVTIPCSLAYVSRPRHGKHLACEAAADAIPDQWDPCDLLDMTGRRLNPPGIKIRAGTLWCDTAVVHPDSGESRGLTGFMTSTGELFGGKWKSIRAFSEGLAAVQDPETGLWGYIDEQGTVIISPRFTLAKSFDRDYAIVATTESDGLLGLIDRNGNIVVEPAWSKLSWFLGKYFLVSDEEAIGLIDNRGNTIIELYYPSREEDAEIDKARGSIRSHPFVRMLGGHLKEKVAAIEPGGRLAPLAGLFSATGANDIELLAAGLWGRRVVVVEDYASEHMRTPIAAGSTGSISWYYPVTASIFDLSKEAPVLGLSIVPHSSIGVPWELLRFADRCRRLS